MLLLVKKWLSIKDLVLTTKLFHICAIILAYVVWNQLIYKKKNILIPLLETLDNYTHQYLCTVHVAHMYIAFVQFWIFYYIIWRAKNIHLGMLSGQPQPDQDRLNKPKPDQSPEWRTRSVSGRYLELGARSDWNQ